MDFSGDGARGLTALEAYTALGALAAATERVQLSTLVTGNTYRNPTVVLASGLNAVASLSAGRCSVSRHHRFEQARPVDDRPDHALTPRSWPSITGA